MARPKREQEISERFGEPLEIWLPRLLAEYKTEYKVAAYLGVYPYTVRLWKAKIGWQKSAAK